MASKNYRLILIGLSFLSTASISAQADLKSLTGFQGYWQSDNVVLHFVLQNTNTQEEPFLEKHLCRASVFQTTGECLNSDPSIVLWNDTIKKLCGSSQRTDSTPCDLSYELDPSRSDVLLEGVVPAPHGWKPSSYERIK
ncbi:hypothetical protein WDW37_06085 [Bdellovibrionota bacterium FG-1]